MLQQAGGVGKGRSLPGDDVHDVHVGPEEVGVFGAQKRRGGAGESAPSVVNRRPCNVRTLPTKQHGVSMSTERVLAGRCAGVSVRLTGHRAVGLHGGTAL